MPRPTAAASGHAAQPATSVPLEQVRGALAHLYDPVHLQTHPLAGVGGGKELHRALLEAVDALKPPRGAPADARAARRHQLLKLRYVDGLPVEEVQQRLAIGRSEYYREHERAVAAVASLLRGRGQRADEPAGRTPGPVPDRSEAPARGTEPAGQLPLPLTSFVGREGELAEVARLLGTTRLVTLTGSGGSGKTRLALAAAGAASDRFPDGVVFVSLAPVADPALVLPTVARALGVRAAAGQPIGEAVAGHLGARAVLLVLDNFERVLPAAEAVAALLRGCPRLAVLVTSRAPLRLSGEHELAVPPLPVPPAGGTADLGGYAALRLFAERARAVRAAFVLTPDNEAAVAEVCRRVDGLPLAIELAAARIRLFSPDGLLARMERRLPVLTGGAHDLPPRQQTLRDTIAWSHDLLAPSERVLFRRLAVFVDGCTLEAAEAVCDPDRDLDVLGGVESLLAQSLLQRDETAGVPRLRLLELVREYALERLAEADELEALRRAHGTHFVEWLPALVGGTEDAVWLDAEEREYGNLRAALGWTVEAGEAELGLALADCLFWFWVVRGDRDEGRGWLTRLLALPAARARTAARARELRHLANLCAQVGDAVGRDRAFGESLAIARELGDEPDLVDALFQCAFQALERGDLAAARGLADEAVAVGRRAGANRDTAGALNVLGLVAMDVGDLREARARFEEGLALQRSVKDVWGAAFVLGNLGRLAAIEGDAAEAERLHREQRALFAAGGDRAGQLDAEVFLAEAAVRRGDPDAARALLLGALPQLRRIGHRGRMTEAIETLAYVEATSGDVERALRWLGAADASREALGLARHSWATAALDEALAPALVTLGPDAAQAAREGGRAMTLEQAVADAMSDADADG